MTRSLHNYYAPAIHDANMRQVPECCWAWLPAYVSTQYPPLCQTIHVRAVVVVQLMVMALNSAYFSVVALFIVFNRGLCDCCDYFYHISCRFS